MEEKKSRQQRNSLKIIYLIIKVFLKNEKNYVSNLKITY